MNNHEVELRVLLESDEAGSITGKIEKSGAIFKSKQNLTDVYFCDKSAKCFEDTEMDKVGSYSLRLRKTQGENNTKTELNMKIITSEGDHHAWEEHEAEVSSLEEMEAMLKAMSQKAFIKIEKERTVFSKGNMLINLEDIKDFGVGLEIEIITSFDNAQNAKNTIKDYLHSIGIADDKIVPKSITNILMHEKSKF